MTSYSAKCLENAGEETHAQLHQSRFALRVCPPTLFSIQRQSKSRLDGSPHRHSRPMPVSHNPIHAPPPEPLQAAVKQPLPDDRAPPAVDDESQHPRYKTQKCMPTQRHGNMQETKREGRQQGRQQGARMEGEPGEDEKSEGTREGQAGNAMDGEPGRGAGKEDRKSIRRGKAMGPESGI